MTVTTEIETQPALKKGKKRVASELKTVVQVKESDQETWKEVSKILTISRNGAAFRLTRPCVVGRLISLVMPLDPELRAYDKKEEVYPVVAIVQYCTAATIDGQTFYHVGVGFVGKNMPGSYLANPAQSYRIVGMKKDGLWAIAEAQLEFKNRRQPRYWISVPVLVTTLQRGKSPGGKERTTTKNICAGGVSVLCSLEARIGDKVKFACKELDFYTMAIVRNRKAEKDGQRTLHLEFLDREFPVDRIVAKRVAEVAAG